jgi:hypothetical protein
MKILLLLSISKAWGASEPSKVFVVLATISQWIIMNLLKDYYV